MDGDLTKSQIDALAKAIDNNQQDSPTLALDPDSKKMTVVGNPNNTHPSSGEYKIVFAYRPDEVTEEDKKTLKYDKARDLYLATVTYTNRRVRPVYRMQVTSLLLNTLADVGIITSRGYASSVVNAASGQIFLNHTTDILTMAEVVLGESKERLEYMDDTVSFVTQLVNNEPNILQEALGFLRSGSQKQQTKDQNEKAKTNTTRN